MKTCTEAERAFLDASFKPHGNFREEQDVVWDARVAVLKERLPPELIEQAIRVRADYHRIRRIDGEIWDRFVALGFVGDMPGGTMWRQIDEAAKKMLGDAGAPPTRDELFDDAMRRPAP